MYVFVFVVAVKLKTAVVISQMYVWAIVYCFIFNPVFSLWHLRNSVETKKYIYNKTKTKQPIANKRKHLVDIMTKDTAMFFAYLQTALFLLVLLLAWLQK